MRIVNVGRMVVSCFLASALALTAQDASPGMKQPTILYGAAYYNEYMPAALQPGRLDVDVKLMKEAGISVVRMGESTWSLWEPKDGVFEYAWMDRVVDAMGKAGIRVIMGTPTYSIPTWLAKAHPEMLARPMGGGETGYGMRQNMNTDDPNYRHSAEELIIHLAEHYKNNPTVIGWQIDNETSSYGATNLSLYPAFIERLKAEFGTTDALNKAWFLNYWGQDVNDWADFPTRDHATSTSYKLEWSRFEQDRVTEFLTWQAALIRAHRRPDQFVTQDFGSMMRADVNEVNVAKVLDVVANNPYWVAQDHMDGEFQAMQGDFSRSLKHGNYLVTETDAQTEGWSSQGQFPPYDGQLRLDVYTHTSSGANMVEYWHWHSIHAGQETYWKGVLSHDLQPNRAYAEVSRVAHELNKVGPQLANLQVHNDVAILYSVDSANAIRFMPYASSPGGWTPGQMSDSYGETVQQLHRALYRANVGTDFVFPTTQNFSQYKLLIVPSLYSANDALLKRIADYVHQGGHVLMTFKSGFTNENSAVRWELAPGPLRDAAGFTYQEFSNLEKPIALRGDPFHAGAGNQVSQWAEFLRPSTAKALATYDHPFFGRWPAITRNSWGAGTLTYEGTALSPELQQAVVLDALRDSGISVDVAAVASPVRVKRGRTANGRTLTYLLNYSSDAQTVPFTGAPGKDLLTDAPVAAGARVHLQPWDLMIVESSTSATATARLR